MIFENITRKISLDTTNISNYEYLKIREGLTKGYTALSNSFRLANPRLGLNSNFLSYDTSQSSEKCPRRKPDEKRQT